MSDDDFWRGPGRHKSPRGAVIEAYVDTDALDRQCPPPPTGCGANLGEFCKSPNGFERHIPCIARTKPAAGDDR
jgi:hypothetical protein